MSNLKYCPNCGDPLNPGSNRCTCGWQSKQSVDLDYNPRHGLCAYTNGHQHCPLTGTIADSTRCTSSTPFYCRFHIETRHTPQIADQVLQQILRGEIKVNKVDWRDELIDNILSRRRAA